MKADIADALSWMELALVPEVAAVAFAVGALVDMGVVLRTETRTLRWAPGLAAAAGSILTVIWIVASWAGVPDTTFPGFGAPFREYLTLAAAVVVGFLSFAELAAVFTNDEAFRTPFAFAWAAVALAIVCVGAGLPAVAYLVIVVGPPVLGYRFSR